MNKWAALILAGLISVPVALPEDSHAKDAGFADVSGTFWAKDEINSMVQLGILTGYEDNSFKPNKPVSREEFATLITKAFYLNFSGNQTQTFTDVGVDRWSYDEIESAKEYLTGYYPPSGRAFFDPTGKATREDVAVALVKTLGYQPDDLQNQNILDRYSDGDEVSPNVASYVALAIEKKLMTGYEGSWGYLSFKPSEAVTRAEAAALLYRVIKNASGDNQQKLALNVSAPETTSSSSFYISGDVTKGAEVYINNEEVDVVQGQFRAGFQLREEGTYTYTITARIPGGKSQTVTKSVTYQRVAPLLEVTGVPETTDKKSVTVNWLVRDENDYNPVVYVNGKQVYGNYYTLDLVEGVNQIIVRAVNDAGLSAEVIKNVIFQGNPPILNILNVPSTTTKKELTVSWTVTDKNDLYPTVYVNEKKQYFNSTVLSLKEGENFITFKAVNSLGKVTEVVKTITFSSAAPILNVDLPTETDTNPVKLTWTVTDANDSYPKVYVNGSDFSYSKNATLKLNEGENTIVIQAKNNSGKTVEVIKKVTFTPPAPTLTFGYVPENVSVNTFKLTWTVSDKNDNYPKVYVNDKLIEYNSSLDVSLTPGQNTFVFVVSNSFGKTTTKKVVINYFSPEQSPETTPLTD